MGGWCARKPLCFFHDLVYFHDIGEVRQKLVDLHKRALALVQNLGPLLHTHGAKAYVALSRHTDPWSYRMIQCNAALVSGDLSWLWLEPPSVHKPRRFYFETSEDTPQPPSDSSE